MKQLYGMLLALLGLSATPSALHAQAVDSLHTKLDYLFAPLDKSQVLTGRLLEAAEPLAWPPYCDGRRLDDTSRTTLAIWRGLYATAASGRLSGADTLPAGPVTS